MVVYYTLLSCGECVKFSMKVLVFLDKVSNLELERRVLFFYCSLDRFILNDDYVPELVH